MSDKLDVKQVGGGAISASALLFFLQSQGVGVINRESSAEAARALISSNKERIEKVEGEIKGLTSKIDDGFETIGDKLSDQKDYFLRIFQAKSGDRYTRTEHIGYAEANRERFRLIDKQLLQLESRLDKIEDGK